MAIFVRAVSGKRNSIRDLKCVIERKQGYG